MYSGSFFLQMAAQAVDVYRGMPRRQGVISHQTLVARHIFAGGDHRLVDRRVFGQACIDLAQFDTEAADFHLIVVTTEVFDIAVWQIATQVASAVHACCRVLVERILEEAFDGQVVAVQVTARHTGTADVDFTRNTQRHGLLLLVQQIELRITDRLADVRSEAVFAFHRHPARVGGGFRRAVEVAQAQHAGVLEQVFHQAVLERFTGHVHGVHRFRQPIHVQQRFQRRRHGVDQADIVFAVLQLQHVLDHLDAATRGQRRKALVDGEVEVQRGGEQRFSSAEASKALCAQVRKFTVLRCSIITPFGRPVEPRYRSGTPDAPKSAPAPADSGRIRPASCPNQG